MTTATITKLHLIKDYEKHKCTLKVIDNTLVHADKLPKATVKQMMLISITTNNILLKCSQNSRPTTNSYTATTSTATTGANFHSSECCPPLTAVECSLVTKHGGCFHCCCFYCGHIVSACTSGFSNKSTYRPFTEADGLMVKKHNSKKVSATPAAVVVTTESTILVAVMMPLAVLGNGTDSEYIEAPFFSPHLYFDCTAGGPSASTELSV